MGLKTPPLVRLPMFHQSQTVEPPETKHDGSASTVENLTVALTTPLLQTRTTGLPSAVGSIFWKPVPSPR